VHEASGLLREGKSGKKIKTQSTSKQQVPKLKNNQGEKEAALAVITTYPITYAGGIKHH